MKNRLRIATRTSELAIKQTDIVASQLQALYPKLTIEKIKIKTQGDKILNQSLTKIGGKGLFVKELEQAILDDKADIAVHSSKDMPADCPDGLELSVFLKRESPWDVFVSNHYASLLDLPHGAVVGTSSLRRQCQLKVFRPDLTFKLLRGNILTRIKKLDAGDYDGIILAEAGLNRLGLNERVTQQFKREQMIPAVGQGAICIESRCNDQDVLTLIQPLNNHETNLCVGAERAMNQLLQGNCQVPIAGYALMNADQISLWGFVGDPDSDQVFYAHQQGTSEETKTLGESVAKDLLQQGADRILLRFI